MSNASVAISQVGWVSEPQGRGTFSLICSCLLTLTFCVWSALHLNIPPSDFTFKYLFLEKTKWVLLGIFAPELVVATAAGQHIRARWLRTQINSDISPTNNPKSRQKCWSLTQCFYALMGGLAVNLPFNHNKRVTLTAEGVRLLSFFGVCPSIERRQIQDKSKADWFAKSVVCLQAGWLVAQVLGRLIIRLPISFLEINTCGHVVCAFTLYLLWWTKPLDVEHPNLLPESDELTEILAFMYMASKINVAEFNGFNDIRCFSLDREGYESGQSTRSLPLGNETALELVNMSIGSVCASNPVHFFGSSRVLSHFRIVTLPKEPGRGTRHRYEYFVQNNKLEVSPYCRQYLHEQYANISLRHSHHYCRKGFTQGDPEKLSPPISPHILSLAGKAAQRLWTLCQARESFCPYYFTVVSNRDEVFIGECDYMVESIPNLPSLSDLTLGHVNINRNVLLCVLAATAALYGGLHLSAWNEFCPSRAEWVLWTASSMIIASSGLLMLLYFVVKHFLDEHESTRYKNFEKSWRDSARD